MTINRCTFVCEIDENKVFVSGVFFRAIDIIDESEMRDNVCVAFLEIECYEKLSDSQYDAERKPHKTTDACIKTCCTSLSWDRYIDDSPLEWFCV